MAQLFSFGSRSSRVPIMSASVLDDRTRPPGQVTHPAWLRHRQARRHMRESAPPPSRSRRWLRRLLRQGDD